MSTRSRRHGAKARKTEKARSKHAKLMEQRRMNRRDEEYRVIREFFETRRGWHWFRAFHRLRVRWQWLALIILFVCLCCWLLGLHVFGHVGLAMAIEQVLHRLAERSIAFVEEI